jgi:hypothetical protein
MHHLGMNKIVINLVLILHLLISLVRMHVQIIFQGHQINFLEKIWHREANISCIQLQALNQKSIRRLSPLARRRFSTPQHARRAAPTPTRRVALLRPRPRRRPGR